MIKIKFRLEDIEKKLSQITSSMSDTNINEDLKTVLFNIDETGKVSIGSYVYVVSIYDYVEALEVEGAGQFTVGAMEFRDILKNCKTTGIEVDYVELVYEKSGVYINIHEIGTDIDNEYLANYENTTKMDLVLISKPNRRLNFEILETDFDEVIEINREELLFALKALSPKLDKDLNKPSACLYFTEEWVYCITNSLTSYIKNMTGIPNNINLSVKITDFLIKLLESEQGELNLYYKDNIMIFITNSCIVQYNLPQMRSQDEKLKKFTTEIDFSKGAILNHDLLDLVIRRASIVDTKLNFNIKADTAEITTSNKKYTTTIPLVKTNLINDIKFAVTIKMLVNAIHKKEAPYILYPSAGKLKICDITKVWNSVVGYEEDARI